MSRLAQPLSLPVHTLALSETTLAYVDQDGPGLPAVFVPGYTGSKEDFGPLFPLLTEHRLVALDQRGQYRSTGPTDPAGYTVAVLAEDLAGLCRHVGTPVHLVGHSFGGLVARAAVIADPSLVASLTLLDSGPAALGGVRAVHMELMRPLLLDGGLPAVLEAQRALSAMDPTFELPPAPVVEFLEERLLSSTEAGLVGMGEAILTEPDRVDELARTGVRILVAYGAGDDAWSPEEQQAMAERLGAERVVIEGARHSPAVEAPAATADALRAFWAATPGAAAPRT